MLQRTMTRSLLNSVGHVVNIHMRSRQMQQGLGQFTKRTDCLQVEEWIGSHAKTCPLYTHRLRAHHPLQCDGLLYSHATQDAPGLSV